MARSALALVFCVSCVSHLDLLDAGAAADGGDGGQDAGPVCDAGLAEAACAAPFAGCSAFTDLTHSNAAVSFGGLVGTQYSPNCVQIRVGQPITFSGDFSTHPIAQSCGPGTLIPQTPPGATATFTPCAPGLYGFYCQQHGTPAGGGMAGAIQVVP